MVDGEDKEAQAIWDSYAAKDAAKASGEAEPSASIEGTTETPPADNTEVKTTEAASADQANAGKVEDKETDDKASGDKDAAPDIWANADPALRTAYEAMRNERDAKENAFKRVSGVVSAHQRKADDLQRQLNDALKGKATTEGDSKDASSILDNPAFKKVEEDFPEIIAPVKAALSAMKGELEGAKQALGRITSKHDEADTVEQSTILLGVHPDYAQIARTPEFRAWYDTAPPSIQEGVRRNATKVVNGQEVASIVTLYKAETGFVSKTKPAKSDPAPSNQKPSDPKRSKQLESAATPASTRRAKIMHDPGPPNDGGQGDWAYWAAKDREKAAAQQQR
jgi:hypothetical protein